MPSWNELMVELQPAAIPPLPAPPNHAQLRKKYLQQLHALTKRNIIVYYSGWLQKPQLTKEKAIRFDINDADKEAFMAAIHGMDRSLGLDLLLHTPGGEMAATESIIDYLRAMFADVRAVVPQIAMSGGTMIACSCDRIVMGKQSSLGPVDPQTNGMAAHGVIEEFRRAVKAVSKNPALVPIWQVIINKYPPTLVGECEKSMKWAREMVSERLQKHMFKSAKMPKTRALKVVRELASHAMTKSHSRHISIDKAREIGLLVDGLEDDQKLQDAALSVHHACILTLMQTNTIKLIENHMGIGQSIQVQMVNAPPKQ